MVAAVNQVFGWRKREAGEGPSCSAAAAKIRCPSSRSRPKDVRDSLLIGGARKRRSPCGTCRRWRQPLSKGPTVPAWPLSARARWCVCSMPASLARPVFVAEDGVSSRCGQRDLAVLVAGRTEADAIREALAARGVRSVYLSDRDSVFATAAAEALIHWLAACAEPDDPRLLRAALATALLGLRWRELEALNRDELAWEAQVMQFRAYREIWRKQGVLPMLRRLMNDFGLPARLLAAATGPWRRRAVLTDLLHLAELLQQAAAQLDGEHALIRYLAEQCADPPVAMARHVRSGSRAMPTWCRWSRFTSRRARIPARVPALCCGLPSAGGERLSDRAATGGRSPRTVALGRRASAGARRRAARRPTSENSTLR